MHRHTTRDERGATLVILALTLTGVLAVAALAIDGGRLFTGRRQVQNAADTAAVAGAQALFAYQYADATGGAPDPNSIWAAVQAKLSQNQATSSVSCVLATSLGAPATDQNGNVETCSGATDAQLLAASGVQAGGSSVQQGAFSGLVGVNQYSSSASATATVQPLGSTGSPFIVCGAANLGWNFLTDRNTIIIKDAEKLQNIPLEWSQLGQGYDCNAPTSKFKGLASQTAGITGPGQYEGITNGNRYSAAVANEVAGQVPCPPDLNHTPITTPCDMVIPIAAGANTDPSNPELLIVTFAIFQVSPASGGGVKYTGTFIAPSSLAALGGGVFGATCQVGTQVCVARLVA
jgi:Flp pilus assembly protein TadG